MVPEIGTSEIQECVIAARKPIGPRDPIAQHYEHRGGGKPRDHATHAEHER
jgi:hypothetical protein